jgi:hypothetical protein
MTRQTLWLWRQLSKTQVSFENLVRLATFMELGSRERLRKLARPRLERVIVLALIAGDLELTT